MTDADYRACLERGACTPPERSSSATHPNYWLDPAFSRHPVVNVGWEAASRYCAALGKRLPTAAEWEVAASYAPATRRHYLYPWGDRFQTPGGQRRRRRHRRHAGGGHLPPGRLEPGGYDGRRRQRSRVDLHRGAAARDRHGETSYVVKGGAYGDAADQLTAAAQRLLPAATAEPWLGFRCARSQMPTP